MGKRAIIYARISRDKRRGSLDEGIGAETQVLECRAKLAEPRGYDVVAVLVDNDISAYSGKPRPKYLTALRMIEAGQADVVLAWHTDRIHRDNTELEDYIKAVEPRDVKTETVTAGELDLNTPIGRMVARQLCTIARYESEHRAERVRLARERQAREGRYGGGNRRPYGFEKDGVTPVPVECDNIRRMARGVLSNISLRSIAFGLREAEFLTSGGTRFTPDAVRAILLRPRNAGLLVHSTRRNPVFYTEGEIVGKASWDAIIPEDEWRAVVQKLTDKSRRTNKGAGPAPKSLGTGICRCVCGGPLRANASGSKTKRPVYRCVEPGSGHVAIHMAELDEFIERVAVERLSRGDIADLVVASDDGIDTAALGGELAVHRARLTEIAEDYDADKITRPQMLTMTESRRAKIAAIEIQLASASEVSPLLPLIGVSDVRAAWNASSLGEKRAILQALFTITVLSIGPGWRVTVDKRVRFDKPQPRKNAA